MEENYNFAEGDNVFVYFNDLLYEAKCIKRRRTDYGENQYFIHYKGWKSTWDEWIDENEALEINPINCRHQERLQETFNEKQKLKETKSKNKTEKPKKKINTSVVKKRGRPRKTVTKKNVPCPRSVNNKKKPTTSVAETSSQTNKNPQKKGQLKKAVSIPKNNTIDKAKDKIKATNNESIPSTSTMESNIEIAKNVKTYTNKTKKLTNEVIENIDTTKPSQSIDIDCCNKFQPEYEPVQKRLKTYTKNETTTELQVNTNNIPEGATENIKEQVAEQISISGPSQPVDVNYCNVSDDAKENKSEQALRDDAAICAVSDIHLHVVPYSARLGNKLRFAMILPDKLRKVVMDDWLAHNHHQKIPKFQDVHYVANVAYTFTESCTYTDDSQKQASMTLCIRLMEYFNNVIHSQIAYLNEIKEGIQFKGMSHFRKRLADQPNITYVLKEHIVPKKIWCYVYGPIYLLRFLVRLPFVILTTTWKPEFDFDFIVKYLNKMMQFLDDNIDTYFSTIDYME